MKRTIIWILACSGATLAGQAPDARVIDWRADVTLLARELPRRHPDPFRRITRAQWDSAANDLDRRLSGLTRNQALVGILRLVAMVGDAHTTVEPTPELGLRYYPIELYSFDDGLFVRSADSSVAGLVGAKVLRIGAVTSEQALASVAAIVPHENDWWVRAWGPFWLTIPEIVDGLGLAPDVERLPLVIERGGRIDTVRVAPAGRFRAAEGPVPIDMRHWVSMREGPAPLWEQHPDEPFWWTLDSASRSLYVALRAVVPGPQSNSNRALWDQVFGLIDSTAPRRVVIDLRENLGGNGFLNRYPIQQLLARPALNRSDRLFVVIGRRTFSAGQQFTNLLEWWTQATFVGEPTGQRPSQYGDHRPLELPASRLTVQISTVFHQAPNEFDTRTFVPPTIYTPLTATAYRRGIDPTWTAILAPDTTPAVALLVDRLVAAGNSAGAERTLRAARDAVANRFRSLEGDINALGYRLLGEGKTGPAVDVLRLNTRVYPQSANAFDSLGEALLAAGKRVEAIAAYRHAVQIDPEFAPSLAALRRLGVAPETTR